MTPDVILASPEKSALVKAIEKAKAIHEKIKAVDARLVEMGVVESMIHDEMTVDGSNHEEVAVLMGERMALVLELEAFQGGK